VTRDRRLERRLGAVVIGWGVLLAANDALPYVGLRDDSCQTMFCGLEWGERWNSHLFVPQWALSDLWAYLDVTDVEITPAPRGARHEAIARWLRLPERDRNTEAVRVAVAQLCEAGHEVSLSTRRTDGQHELVHHPDACAEPALSSPHRWIPVRLYETDIPRRPPHP
jgi:hypothetical protein